MASRILVTFENGRFKQRTSTAETIDFLSLKVGTDGLEISEASSSAFSFNSKKLSSVSDGSANSDASTVGQMNNAIAASVSGYIPVGQKGTSGGVATLDGGGKIPATQLPNSVMEFQGVWSAATNTPTLADGSGNLGDVYWVNVSGTQDLGGGSQTFLPGDFVIYDASAKWTKSINSNAVASVNSKTGVVTLTTDDISEGTAKYFSTAAVRATDLTGLSVSGGGAVAAGDTILEAFGKLENRVALDDAKVSYDASTARSDLIAASISNGDTTHAPDGNSVFAALGGKEPTVAAGTSGEYYRGDKTFVNFDSAAQTAAVVNTTAGSETAQAASVSSMKSYVASQLGSSVSRSFQNIEGVSGDSITARQFVFESAVGQVELAQANDTLTPETLIGCVKDASISNPASGEIYMPGKGTVVGGFSGLVVGSPIFLSRSTAGSYQQNTTGFVAGEHLISLGTVVSATEIVFEPNYRIEF